MTEPLAGIRVLELASAVQGPAAALYLSDMGAEVIKVERPTGDGSRFLRGRNNPFPPDAHGTQFVAVNRGKRSICLDAAGECGYAALQRLAERSDVFLSNYRAPALARMGLDYESLRALNPGLIYAHVSGFGPKGALRDKAMVDGVAQARGGLPSLTGTPEGSPTLVGAAIADTAGAMQLALGVMTALVARERHGVGQQVSTSGYGAQIWLQMWELTHVAATGKTLSRSGGHHPNLPGTYGLYETADGHHVFLAFPMTTQAWVDLWDFAGEPELAADESLHTPLRWFGKLDPDPHFERIRERLTRAFLARPLKEWEEFLEQQPEIIWNRLFQHDEVLSDPQALANGYFEEMEIPGIGRTRVVGNLVHLSETPGSAKGPSAEQGQHTEEILLELGYSWDDIGALNQETEQSLNKSDLRGGRPL